VFGDLAARAGQEREEVGEDVELVHEGGDGVGGFLLL
jgi:hypothetical protein